MSWGGVLSDSYESGDATLYPYHEFGIIESGVPFTCFEGFIHRRDNHIIGRKWVVAFREDMVTDLGAVPLRPRAVPFILNTILYAALTFFLIAVVRRLRSQSEKPDAGDGT